MLPIHAAAVTYKATNIEIENTHRSKEGTLIMASSSRRQEKQNDVTKAIQDAVTKMMARAAVNKNGGKHFNIDKDRCHDFIDQQIELVPPAQDSKHIQSQAATEGAVTCMYQDITIIRNSSEHTFRVPISKKSTTDHSEVSEDRREHEGGCSASAGLQESIKKAAKSSTNCTSLPLSVSIGATGRTGLNRLGTTVNTSHQEYAVSEASVPGKTNIVYSPKGVGICTIQLTLRARKNLTVKVYRKKNTKVGAKIGAGAGAVAAGVSGAAGGVALGAIIGGILGTVVPGVGNVIGAVVGGGIGGLVGGVGLGAAGSGIGAGAGAGIGAGGAATHRALRPITLTIEEIFKENTMNESAKKSALQYTSRDYIYCIVDYPYVTDYSSASIN